MKSNILHKQWSDYEKGLLTIHCLFGTIVDSVTLESFPKTVANMPEEMLKEFINYVGLDANTTKSGVSSLRLKGCDGDFEVATKALNEKLSSIRVIISEIASC